MTFEQNLEKYADLIVTIGLGLKPDDKLIIYLNQDGLPLARLVSRKAYQKGVIDIRLEFTDDIMALDRYLYAPDKALEFFPQYRVEAIENLLKDGYNRLSLLAEDPDLLKPVDPARIAAWQKTAGKASKPLQKYTMENKVKWCVVGVACPAWAKAVFPELPAEEGMHKLWDNIFSATRADLADPVSAWKEHDAALKARKNFLNNARFDYLYYQGPGTDLKVHLVQDHIWEGGSSRSQAGEVFMPNIPTEEIFSMPHADGVDGTLRATMPLSVRGQIVDDFHFTFKDGRVVDFDAGTGKQILADLLEMDEGARRLGEIALVAANSPISNTGILFKNTLFDENASCHFALGAAYSENLKGATEREDAENRKLGMNDSLIHVDFMVGGRDVTVTGVKPDGSQIILLKDGEWQI
ncbi:MAG: aminopeptidase [Anaerolineaceae bacterium]